MNRSRAWLTSLLLLSACSSGASQSATLILDNPTWDRWFNTSVFRQATPFTPRTNPFQYDGLTGPGNWNLDTTLSKNFKLTERFKLEFRLEGYNLTNSVMPGNPGLRVLSAMFGRVNTQVNYGREVQYTLRLHF